MGNVLKKKEEDPILKKQSSVRQSVASLGLLLVLVLVLVIAGVSIVGAVQTSDPGGLSCSAEWQPAAFRRPAANASATAALVVCTWPAAHTAARLAAAAASAALCTLSVAKMTCRRSKRKLVYVAVTALAGLQALAWFAMGAWDAQRVAASNSLCGAASSPALSCDYSRFVTAPALCLVTAVTFLLLTPLMVQYTRKNDYLRNRILVHKGDILDDEPAPDAKAKSKKKKKSRRKKNDIELPPMSEDDLDDLPL